MSLDDNQLSRPEIPTELSSLPNLEELALGGYQLSGSIPAELGSLCQPDRVVPCGSNQLSGEIPSELGGLVQSTDDLYLGAITSLSGEIPSELGGLANFDCVCTPVLQPAKR